jgi:hypothetical protein
MTVNDAIMKLHIVTRNFVFTFYLLSRKTVRSTISEFKCKNIKVVEKYPT